MLWIYDLGYRVFFWGKRLRKRVPGLEKLFRNYEYYFGLFLNRKMIPWFEKHPVKWGLNTKKREESYTVSLTSFPARIDYVHITVETLLRQSFKPDRIILWLAESQFPDRKLPEKLTALQDKGLTIRFCDDLRSHKKYVYTFLEYPADQVILSDDDAFYSRDMVATLVRLHKKYPKDIIGSTAQIIGPDVYSMPSVWPVPEVRKRYISMWQVQPFSGQGTLYPAKWYPRELFNKEKALALAGTADDLWLQAMGLVAGVKTTLVYPQRGFPVEIEIENNLTLFQQNKATGENRNDLTWKALVEEYGEGWKTL